MLQRRLVITHNILTVVEIILRWPNRFQDAREEKGITFSIPKVLIKIIPFNITTWKKRIFVKVMLSFKKRDFV